jgi:hypothetical protein
MKEKVNNTIATQAGKIESKRLKPKDSLSFDKRIISANYAGIVTRIACLLFSIPFGIMLSEMIPIFQYVPIEYRGFSVNVFGISMAFCFEIFRHYFATKAWSAILQNKLELNEQATIIFGKLPVSYLAISFLIAVSSFAGYQGMKYSSEHLMDKTPTLLTNWDGRIDKESARFDKLISDRKKEANDYFEKVKYKGKIGTTQPKIYHANLLKSALAMEAQKNIAVNSLIADKRLDTDRNISKQEQEGTYTAYISLFVEALSFGMEYLLFIVIVSKRKFNGSGSKKAINKPNSSPIRRPMIPNANPSPTLSNDKKGIGFEQSENREKGNFECLECGNSLGHLKSDAKFCLTKCKNKYNYKNRPK